MINRRQIAAGRALLGWSRQELSEASGISLRTVARFESGEGDITTGKLAKMEAALMEAGVRFIPNGVQLDDGRGI